MISSSRNVHPSSHMRVSPLSTNERPCMWVTCASWETGSKLVWTWPSSIYTLDLDLSKWQPTPVFLPGKSHGLRILVGYSPWGRKGSDTTEWLHFTSLLQVLSTLMMFKWDHVLFMRTFRPDCDLCALGHGDPGRDLAWPLSWKTPCLHLNVRAQMSGLWGWGGLLWVTVLFSEWGSMALPGSVLR